MKSLAKYDIAVKDSADLEKLLKQFESFSTIESSVNNSFVALFNKKEVRLLVNDYFGEIQVGDIVHHFKGNDYKILDKATDSDTGKDMFVYLALYSPYTKYIRYVDEFYDLVDFTRYRNSTQAYRFIKIIPDRT